MTTAASASPRVNERELLGQTVVIIGGSAGIGLETARRARADGAEVILTARNPAPLAEAAREVGALSTAAFDASDSASLEHFFDSLPDPIDHVLVQPAVRITDRCSRWTPMTSAARSPIT